MKGISEGKIKKYGYLWLITVMVLLINGIGLSQQKEARGLATKFADVILAYLKPGMVYSIKKEQRLSYKVTNQSTMKLPLVATVVTPRGEELKPGYEPIPDPAWIKIVPSRFDLEPGEVSDCDVIISIPPDEEFANRNFQAFLVTETVAPPEEPGMYIALGLKTRLRFSTGPTPAETLAEFRRKTLEALKIDLAPFDLYLSEIPTGEIVQLGKREYPTLQLVNRGNESYKIKFELATDASVYGLTKDYIPAPDKTWLRIVRKIVKVKQRQIKDIEMELKIPDEEEYRGKFFAFVVIGEIEGLDFPVSIYSRLYIKTKE
jgi:hypothetical protein